MSDKFIEPKCPCCDSDEIIDKFPANNYRTKDADSANYVRCRSCGSLYVNSRLISIRKNDNYDERYKHTYEKLINKLKRKWYRFLACWMYGLLSGFFHIKLPLEWNAGEKLLDIGCGIGLQTKFLQKRGLKIEGIDSSSQAIKSANEINDGEEFNCKDIFELNNKEKYDFIRLDNVVEHIGNPEQLFGYILELLKLDGKLIIFTPNAGSASLKFLRGKSVSAWPDEHVIIFSEKGLIDLLERTGFEIKRVCRNTPSWWLAYNLLMVVGVGEKVTADTFLLKIISICMLPMTYILNLLNLNEEIVIEAILRSDSKFDN